jgi:ubiquinone/menaquinone biosynthesis C-methylase UbiE
MRKVDRLEIPYTGRMVDQYDQRRFGGAKNAYLERVRAASMIAAVGRSNFDRKILDVGCGTFRGLLELQRAGFFNLRGLELSEEMIRVGRAKLRQAVPIDRGSAFQMPYQDGAFDVVTSWNFVHMFRLDRQVQLIAEMARVCQPGGTVVVELDSLHKGGWAVVADQWRKRGSTKFTAIWEVRKLFPKEQFTRIRVRGAAFPLLYHVFHRIPAIGFTVERAAFVPPLNWLAGRVVISARRRAG